MEQICINHKGLDEAVNGAEVTAFQILLSCI